MSLSGFDSTKWQWHVRSKKRQLKEITKEKQKVITCHFDLEN
jgi:hypothetical protein